MIVQISEIRIKLPDSLDVRISTCIFDQIIHNYLINPASSFDFEIFVSDLPSDYRNIHNFQKFRDTLYYENETISCFKKSSMESVIDWKNKCMYISFSANAEYHDRLFLEQLKLLVSLLVVKTGGVPIHCSAVAHEKMGGIIFIGPSGAGKTTVAELLSHSCTVFNDEFNIVLPKGNIWYVYSTPFTNPYKFPTFSHNAVQLNLIFFLVQDKENKTIAIPFNRAYTALLENTYTILTRSTTDAVMSNVESIIGSIPHFLLHFAITETFENTILNPEHLFHAYNKTE